MNLSTHTNAARRVASRPTETQSSPGTRCWGNTGLTLVWPPESGVLRSRTGFEHSDTPERGRTETRQLLTSCRLSVRFSCPQLLKHAASAPGSSWAGGSPRANAPRTRHSCLCLRSSSSHSPTRLASRRCLARLRSTVTGKENARCMPHAAPVSNSRLVWHNSHCNYLPQILKSARDWRVPRATSLCSVVPQTIYAHLRLRSCQTRSRSSASCSHRNLHPGRHWT